jgi:hypothetical protein
MLTLWKPLFETGQKVNQNCAKGGEIQKLDNSDLTDFLPKF